MPSGARRRRIAPRSGGKCRSRPAQPAGALKASTCGFCCGYLQMLRMTFARHSPHITTARGECRACNMEFENMRRLNFDWPTETVIAVDEWRKKQPAENMSRNDAARRLANAGLRAEHERQRK